MNRVQFWRGSLCLLVVACAVATSTSEASVIALKRDAGLNTGGPIDARFTSATVVQATVSDAPLWSPGESAWANGGQIAVPNGNYFLYKFDLTSVGDLANATINLAELRLYHTAGNGGQGLGAVAPVVTHDWTEGLGTTVWTYYPGAAGGVSYAHPMGYNTGPYQNASGGTAAPTQSWGVGSDSVFSMSVDAGTALDPDDGYWNATDFNVYNVTSQVQSWVSGTSANYGWAQSPGYWDFHHSEIGWEFQPVLFIDYTPDVPTVTLSIDTAAIAENGGVATVTATLSSTLAEAVTVDLAYSGSAVRNTDYTAALQIVITAGASSAGATITAMDDGTYEGNEAVVVDISGVTNALEDGVQQVNTTINDDESEPTVVLSIDNATIAENGGTATVTATLSNASTQAVTVDVAYSGSAVRDTDYTAAAQIVIGAGSGSGTATITGLDDAISEGSETVTVDISSVTNGTEDGVQQVSTTIADDDGGQASVIALKRDAGLDTGGPIDARFTSAAVVQTTVSDAPLWSPGESAWANGGGIAVPTGNVFLYKFDLTSVPNLANATISLAELRLYHTAGNGGEGLGAVAPVVTHDWIEGLGTVVWTYYPGAAGGVSYAHPMGYNTGPYQNASGGSTVPTQSWGTGSDSVFGMAVDAGTALDPDDGYWSATDFNVYDVTSHVQAWVSGTSPNYGWAQNPGYWDFHHSEIGWQYQPVLFIDYTPAGSPQPTVTFDVTSSNGAESATPVSLTVSLSSAYSQTVTVDYAVTGGSATGGGVDYTLASGSVTFVPDDVSETIDIAIVDDGLVESDETITVTLSNPVNATLGANTAHTYTINDNDAYPAVAFDVASANGAESVTPASLAVSLSSGYGVTVTVDYAVTGGSATGGGVDYTLAAGTLTFNPYDTSETIDITVVDDGLVESDETIEVTLSNAVNATLGATSVHTYTILDNDETAGELPSPWQHQDVGSPSAAGDATYAAGTFTVEGDGVDIWNNSDNFHYVYQAVSGDVEVVARVQSLQNTNSWAKAGVMVRETLSGGSRHAMMVVTPGNGTSFQRRTTTDGASSHTTPYDGATAPYWVRIVRSGDTLTGYRSGDGSNWVEVGSETIAMSADTYVGLPVTSHSDGVLTTAVVTDVAVTGATPLPTVAFDVTGSSGAESTATVNLGVSLSASSAQTVTVAFAVTDGTAANPGDYTIAASPLTFGPGVTQQNVTITVVDDGDVESDETIEVTLSNPTNATLGTNTVHTYTIQDNDVAGGNGTGLLGDYYDNIDFTALTLTRTDATVDFNWGTGSPDPSIGVDSFSVRWTGQVQPLYSETYTFYTNTDDGVRLWVDNQLVVDQWVDQAPAEVSGTIALSAGVQYDIEMEYYENGGGAVAELRWSSASQAKQIIPQSQLYPSAVAPPPTVTLSIDNATIAENGGTAAVTATLSSTSTQTVTVDLAYSGSAVRDTDYTAALQIVIGSGSISGNVTVTAMDDAVVEGDEVVTVDISSVANATEDGVQQVSTTITDDDSSGGVSLLSPRDFLYKGYYIVEKTVDFPDLNYGQAFTHRYVGGQLRFLTYAFFGNVAGGGHHVVEFAPPASLGGTVTNRTNHWPDIWTGTGLTAGNGIWTGLWYDQAQERLWTTWAIDYPDAAAEPYTKSLVIRTLNADGTVSNVGGPWGLEGVQQRRIYGGVTAIPQWFQNAYGVGPYACGWGGYTSRMGIGPVSLGPTFYAIPEPTGYAVGDIPATDFDEVMDHSGGTLGADWYASGLPTSFDRGVRNSDVTNDYDTPYWQSPAPDGVGRWTWGDSNWDTGVWIETPNKRGFVLIPKLCSGRTWYETSTLHCARQTAEIQVFDPNMLGEVVLGTRASWDTYPTYRWQISDELLPLGLLYGRSGNGPDGGPAGASYDATTQTLYVYCIGGSNLSSYILVYDVDQVASPVNDVAIGETPVTGTVTGTRANTENKDGIYESIQEVVAGSTSQLEHKWTFSVTSGSSVIFNVKGYRPGNADGDDFVFAYSTDGTNWTNMVTVSRSTDDGTFQTYTMPSSTQGTVYVRVQDSDRTNGNTSLDVIYVDEIYFHSMP